MFSTLVEAAVRVAIEAHAGQVRKGGDQVPYATHPVHVALMLSRWGHSEVVIQAALLHDVVEDCEDWTFERVEREFGAAVAGIVSEVSEDKSKSWDERKRATVESVPRLSNEGAAVKAMDKLHNLASLADSLEVAPDPDVIWGRFTGGRDKTLEMSVRLVEALEKRIEPRFGRALRAALERLLGTQSQLS